MRTQVTIGTLLTVFGAADLAGLIPALANYAYAIVWWGVLLLVDAFNFRRYGLSMWRDNGAHFLGIILPASVAVWLFFEMLNLPAPQWIYRADVPGPLRKILLGFASFATVIPIMVEAWWLVAGRQCIPAGMLQFFRDNRLLSLALAVVATVLPFFNNIFWFNQGMWLIPALWLLPFIRPESCSASHFLRALCLSGLIAGLAWESFNYPAPTHWEYLILPDVPHLFYMPLPGYLGFIPFAFSMLAVYQFLQTVKPSPVAVAALYVIALSGLHWLWHTSPPL